MSLSLALVLSAVAVGGCSDVTSRIDNSSVTTTVAVRPTSSVPRTTAATTTSSSSSTSSSTTSTTIAAVVGLGLSAEGIGDESFGAAASGVIAYVESILGSPNGDSGWLDPIALGLPCPGTEIREVAWADLVLFFTNDSTFASGLRHFAAYTYGPATGSHIEPFGLTIDKDIGVGSTVGDLLAAYPDIPINEAGQLGAASFYITDGLIGFLTGVALDDTITTFVGGFGCGE